MLLCMVACLWMLWFWLFDKPLSGNGLDLANMAAARVKTLLEADERALLALIDGVNNLEAEATVLNA
jgi:hypothetical protein